MKRNPFGAGGDDMLARLRIQRDREDSFFSRFREGMSCAWEFIPILLGYFAVLFGLFALCILALAFVSVLFGSPQ